MVSYLDDGVQAQCVRRFAHRLPKVVLDVENGLVVVEEGVDVYLSITDQSEGADTLHRPIRGRICAPIITGDTRC